MSEVLLGILNFDLLILLEIKVESNLGTMVINDEEEDSTMKQYGTAPGQGEYKPDFMEHFDKKDGNNIERSEEEKVKPEPNTSLQVTQEEKLVKENLQRQLNQIAGQGAYTGLGTAGNIGTNNPDSKFQRSINEGDFEFLKYLSYDELTGRMSGLDSEMEREIDDLRRRYHAKRQPILDAMDQKRKRQQNF